MNSIGGAMVSVFAASAGDRGFEPRSGPTKENCFVNFQSNDDEVRLVLDQQALLDLYSASSLKQPSADRHVAPLRHIILVYSQPVFAISP
jgi:hypothetical protein